LIGTGEQENIAKIIYKKVGKVAFDGIYGL
jgi:hypothetical protein